MLTERELCYCWDIANRVQKMREFLSQHQLPFPPQPIEWHSFISAFRKIQGNLSNDGSFIATLLAKQYLCSKFRVAFDAAAKPQGAPGIDIDVNTEDGLRIIGEIKTTVPYQTADFGAQQAAGFKNDFRKLVSAEADYKFLFVTDSGAFSALKKGKYTKLISGVRIVHLATGEEHAT